MTTDELQRLLTIPPPREIRQTGSLVYNVDEREDKRWKAARVRLAEAVPSLLTRIAELEQRAEQAEADVIRLRARTHELQERHDKAYTALTQETAQKVMEYGLMKRDQETARELLGRETGRTYGPHQGVSDKIALALGTVLHENEELRSALAVAAARNEQLATALQALYDDWQGPLTEAVKQAQEVLGDGY